MADEPKSRFRRPKGIIGKWEDFILVLVPVTGAIAILDLPAYIGIYFYIQQYIALFFGYILALSFLLVPFRKKSPREKVPWYDLILSALGLITGLYIAIFYKQTVLELGLLVFYRVVLGTIAVVLVLEASRRILGLAFLVILLVFILYALFTPYFPAIVSGKAASWSRIATFLYLDPQGIFGIPTQVAATIVLAFVLFGQALFKTGGGNFLTDCAMALMGRYRGGPAKVAVLASSLFGTMSGSAVGNVVTTGSVTIPLMKKTGYPPFFAAAIEATASSGGLIMPPVMGAAAFLMATFLGKPYAQIVLAASIPAILYYIALLIQVDLKAARDNLKGLPQERLPKLSSVLREGWPFLVPLCVLIFVLFVMMLNAERAGLYASSTIFLIGFILKKNRLNAKRVVLILEETGQGMLEVGVVCAAAGVIIGIVIFTGLGFTFSHALVSIAGHNSVVLVILAAIGAIILGMGMTVTAAYLLMVILIAPSLIQLGISPLAAHLFVFYFSVMSFLTPPICLAVYAAAAMADAHVMGTAFQAMKLGIAAYIVPFIFIYHPSLLLQGTVIEVTFSVCTALVGIALIGIGSEGFLFRKQGVLKRILFFLAGLCLLVPGWKTDLGGFGLACLLVLLEVKTSVSST